MADDPNQRVGLDTLPAGFTFDWEGDQAEQVREAADRFLGMVRQGHVDPPLMPMTVRKAMELSRDPRASYSLLSTIIETDPSLTAQLLKLANSALFGARERVGGLRHALLRIGMDGLRELLFAAAVGEILVVPGDPQLSERLQKRSVSVAVCARGLARLATLDDDEAFTAGILHDVGWPLAFGLIRANRRELPLSLGSSPELKTQLAERLHEVLGRELALAWDLPEETAMAVGFHHAPSAAPRHADLAWCICAARTLCDEMGIQPEGRPPLEECSALQTLGIEVDAAREVLAEARRRLEDQIPFEDQ